MPSTRSRAPWWLLATVLALLLLLPVSGQSWLGEAPLAFAEELDGDKPAGEGAEEEEDEKGVDLGDQKVSFADQVNEAIEKGVKWLKHRPALFDIKKGEVAHWGLVIGDRNYGGREGDSYKHPAGPTALALYTLLKCGVDPKDDVIKKGFRWLSEKHVATAKWDGFDGRGGIWRHTPYVSSYELSAMILALTAKHDKYKKNSASRSAASKGKLRMPGADKKWLVEMVERLIDIRGEPSPSSGPENRGWRYNVKNFKLGQVGRNMQVPPHANQDLSSTQLACLALYSAQRFGVKVPNDIWLDIISLTLDSQEKEGPKHERFTGSSKYKGPIDNARGFIYIPGSPDGHEGKATSSMTACGVTNLLIARSVLTQTTKGSKAYKKAGYAARVDKGIWDGLAWLDLHWSPFQNKNYGGYHIYYLYALERAMDILEKKLVGKHLWYEEGAKEILSRQVSDVIEVKIKRSTELVQTVYWNTGSTHQPKDVLDTCFALLFLKRATRGLVPGGPVTGDYD